jgi:hypothetical protein
VGKVRMKMKGQGIENNLGTILALIVQNFTG